MSNNMLLFTDIKSLKKLDNFYNIYNLNKLLDLVIIYDYILFEKTEFYLY